MIPLTRRHLLWLLTSAIGLILSTRGARSAPGDHGIGGTGLSAGPTDADGDRGIGGTGVIGTIRKFGSIVVNDLRITYPRDVPVYIDGRPARAADLKLGQVVRVVANRDGGALSTTEIDVGSEVVGRVDAVNGKTLTVLGQTVSARELKDARRWMVGDHVAVSGLRRTDGTIVASLIQPSDGTLSKVAGPVVLGNDGRPRIGGLPLSGLQSPLIGQRAVVVGEVKGDALAVTRGTSEATLLPPSVRRLSIEGYVERRGGHLRLGSGVAVGGASGLTLPAGRSVRAVLTTTRAADGSLAVESVRAGGHDYRPPRSDGAGGRGSDDRGVGGRGGRSGPGQESPDGGRRPMDFGHGPGGQDAPFHVEPEAPRGGGPLGGGGGPLGGGGGPLGSPGGLGPRGGGGRR